MASASQRQEGSDGALSVLDEDIQVLHHAKDTCGIPPVQGVLDSAGVLLTTIRVCSLPFRGGQFQVHLSPGPGVQQTRSH